MKPSKTEIHLTVETAEDAGQVCAALLCRPEARTLLGYTRRILHLQEERRLGVFSFSSGGDANWLFLIAIDDGAVERYAVPNDEQASHGAALGSDGNIYALTFGQQLHRFEVARRCWETLCRPLSPGECPWDAIGAPNGCLYFGTYPNACFGEYRIATGEVFLRKQVAPRAKYVDSFSVLPDGKIRCRAWGPETWIATFDPETRELALRTPGEQEGFEAERYPREPALPMPAVPAGDETFSVATLPDGTRYGIAAPSGRIFRVDREGRAEFQAEGPAGADSWRLLAVDERTVCGVSMLGVFLRYGTADRSVRWTQVPNSSPCANGYMFLEAASPACAVGAHYSQQNLFRVEVETGTWETSPGMIARVTGEPMCALPFGGKVYLGVYIRCLLMVYDPGQPFVFGENPREIAEVGHGQLRPRDFATDGERIYMVSHADYGTLGGALTVLDPESEEIEVFRHVVQDQNPTSLAYDPLTGLLFGGTYRWGDCDSHPPTQESAVVFAWEPRTRRTVRQLALWPGADQVAVRGVLPGGLLVAQQGNEVAILDTRTLGERWRGSFPGGGLRQLRCLDDGRVYGLTGEYLFRWDLDADRIAPLARMDMRFLAIPRPGLFVLGTNNAVYRLELPAET